MKFTLDEFLKGQKWIKNEIESKKIKNPDIKKLFKQWLQEDNCNIRPNHRNLDRLDVFPLSYLDKLKNKGKKNEFVEINGNRIKTTSQRYPVFQKSTTCCECGIEGSFLGIERQPESEGSYHLNLYGIDLNGEEVLFTKDHIIPKSKGGKNHIDNYQTMCSKCNERKGNCS